MLKILIFLLSLNSAFAVKVVVEEDGHKKTISVPDNGKSVDLHMVRKNGQITDNISIKIGNSTKGNAKNTKTTTAKTFKSSTTTNSQQIANKTIVIKPQPQTKTSTQKLKNIELVNVYHYFYPCSANPNMKDCVPDSQIKIDNNTDRMVILNPDGTKKNIDMVDQRLGIKKTVIDDGKPIPQDDLVRTNSPVFDSNSYQNKQIPTNDQYGRINNPQYDTKTIGIVQKTVQNNNPSTTTAPAAATPSAPNPSKQQ